MSPEIIALTAPIVNHLFSNFPFYQLSFIFVFLSEPGWVTRACRMRLIHLPVLPTAFHVHWHLGSRSEALAAGSRVICRNHGFPLGQRNHGAKPRGGKGLGFGASHTHRHTRTREEAKDNQRSRVGNTCQGFVFVFSPGSAHLPGRCWARLTHDCRALAVRTLRRTSFLRGAERAT